VSDGLSHPAKKAVMKDIILALHRGLSTEDARKRFEQEVGDVTSSEIAEIEQGLINDGLSPDEIKKFCNVHALIFQSALEKSASEATFPSHPVYLFKLENREIERIIGEVRQATAVEDLTERKMKLRDLLLKLKQLETHYERKEQLLFPFLEKKGFTGPSKVMWGKDNEVRDLLRAAIAGLDGIYQPAAFSEYAEKALDPALEEVAGMIVKEEQILFPTALQKLDSADWVNILRESDEMGYVFIQRPEETDVLVRTLQAALHEEPVFEGGAVNLPSGNLGLNELLGVLNTLPIDFTFVDKDDTVRYFTEGKGRIFHRPRSIIGRKVQNCHPPQSLHIVERILTSFKEGKQDFYEFWIQLRGKFVHIRYFAVRDRKGQYLGTVEVTQDITGIRKLEGEKRLVSEE